MGGGISADRINKNTGRLLRNLKCSITLPFPFGEAQGLVEDLVVHSLNVCVVIGGKAGQHLYGNEIKIEDGKV